MTSNAQASGPDPVGHEHEHEALLLVELLRTSRLALLYAEPGSDKTALLRSGLMPLLSRRAGDLAVPAIARTSGVVVPFPDRRSRPSSASGKRRREIAVYCGDWTEKPLAVLRDSIYTAVAATSVERIEPSARLSEILEALSERLDASFFILLDRFEDLVADPAQREPLGQLLNELAEAVNQAQVPANFLISVTEEASSRLGALRTRIPGFDDFSLKLAAPRGFEQPAASTGLQEQVRRALIEAVPILTEPLTPPAESAMPARPAEVRLVLRSPGVIKVKRQPLPRREVTLEDVYAMIEAALSRITTNTSDALPVDQRKEPASFCKPTGTFAPLPAASSTPTRGKPLEEAIERMERRLGLRQDKQD